MSGYIAYGGVTPVGGRSVISKGHFIIGSLTTTTLSSSASNVDGLFQILVVFSRAVSGFSLSDISVTNGSAQYLTTSDNITYTVYIVPNGAGNITISVPQGVTLSIVGGIPNAVSNSLIITADTSWLFLSNPLQTFVYYDFRELIGVNTDIISIDDPGLRDLSGNNRTASLINSPQVRARPSVGENGIVALRDELTKCVSIGSTGSSFFNGNFSVNLRAQFADGQPATSFNICGNTDGSGNKGFIITFTTAGNMLISYQSNTLGFVWTSTSSVLTNGQTAVYDFFIDCDFTNDILTVKQDGTNVAGSFTTRSITLTDPTTYAATTDFYIGALNTSGTANSNADAVSIYYFVITSHQGTTSTVRSYLNAKKATFELVSTLTSATYLKNPHDVVISSNGLKAYISGKGDPTLTTVDGSFAIIDISTPASPSILGGYANNADQQDGETVFEASPTRVLHFVSGNALLFDVSNAVSPSKIRTVANATGVINGVVKIGNYLFGANKGGYIDVFDISNIDTFTLVGSYNTNTVDGMIGPHDIDVSADGQHIVIVSRSTGAQFAIYKVFNAGLLIPIASWTRLSSITNAALSQANRVRVHGNTATCHMLNTGGDNIVNIDITTLASPSIIDNFSLTSINSGSAGTGFYRNKYDISATWVGLRLLDITTTPSNIVQDAGYMNANDFTVGSNQNLHDLEVFTISGQNYLIVTCQNNGIAIFKINRL